jgi:cytochrome c6
MAIKRRIKLGVLLAILLSPPVFAGDPFIGAKIYNERCAMCHGANGKAMVAGTPDFANTNILAKPDYELKKFINAGKGIMPGFQGVLKDQEILDVVSYIRTFN